MRVLVIKTSSLGDVIHTLPALTDAARALPGIRFDWVVEEAFAPIPAWHGAVTQVIPVALRRWRRQLLTRRTRHEWRRFREHLQRADYDRVIDAQGLLKSAVLTRLANGTRHGLDRLSAREPLAALAYQVSHAVPSGQHAIERVRQLFAAALDYPAPVNELDYGIYTGDPGDETPRLVFLHATSWPSKHWPEAYWVRLIELATAAGYAVLLPWGSADELARAQRLGAVSALVEVPPAMDLNELAGRFASARGAVAVDTGLGHLAAAFSLPTVSLYGATDAALTGARGRYQSRLQAGFECAPCLQRQCSYTGAAEVQPACYASLPPEVVWAALQQAMREKEER